jgi:AraC-like DNA-binding protein/ligand-binding sensor protein
MDNYAKSLSTTVSLSDLTGDIRHSSGGSKEACSVCKLLNKGGEFQSRCRSARVYGGYQAERFGGKYIYFCPMGMVHWASPLNLDGIMKMALIGGPVLMVEPEDFLMFDVNRKDNLSEEQKAELIGIINELPVLKPDLVNSHSEMLFITAAYLSEGQAGYYRDEREKSEQQADISEYIHQIKSSGAPATGYGNYPIDKEKELVSLISLGDKPGSQKVLNEIFGHIFFSSGGNFDVIRARVLELIVVLSRAAMNGGADVEHIFGLNFKYLSEINDFHTVDELTFWLSRIMTRFTDAVFNLTSVKHIDIIFRAIEYVKHNYMKKITLEEVASHVFLSPSYFSKVFKDEMKCNFNTYLNRIRIEMSKKFLVDDKISLVDVSNLVGYEDQSYYTKVFKKMTGVSPGRYRESRGQTAAAKAAK